MTLITGSELQGGGKKVLNETAAGFCGESRLEEASRFVRKLEINVTLVCILVMLGKDRAVRGAALRRMSVPTAQVRNSQREHELISSLTAAKNIKKI